MAKIYDFELKNIKITEDNFSCSLYYMNKKIGIYEDNSLIFPTLTYEKKVDDILKNEILSIINIYYNNHPKEMLKTDDDYLIIEFIEELYRFKELENIFKKTNKKNENILIELKFSKREKYISEYNKEDICLTTTLWTDEFKEKMLEKYKPVEFNIYKSIDDFNIIKE